MDVAERSEDDFQELVLSTAKDKNLLDQAPPSAAVHQLFSGYAEHSVLMCAEANKDIVCGSLERMADIQEAAVYADVLLSGGQPELGLELFTMAAALEANPNMRYDCTKYRSPWGAFKETLESRAVRESWERRGPKREIIRMAANQERVDAAPAKREQKRQATAAPPRKRRSGRRHLQPNKK